MSSSCSRIERHLHAHGLEPSVARRVRAAWPALRFVAMAPIARIARRGTGSLSATRCALQSAGGRTILRAKVRCVRPACISFLVTSNRLDHDSGEGACHGALTVTVRRAGGLAAPSLPQQPSQRAARDPTPDAAGCTEARAPGREGGWRGVLPIAPTPRRAAAAVGACVVQALAVSGSSDADCGRLGARPGPRTRGR